MQLLPCILVFLASGVSGEEGGCAGDVGKYTAMGDTTSLLQRSLSRQDESKPCPEDCKMGPWGDWSPCSNSCQAGKRTRSRKVEEEEKYGGKCDEPTEAEEECEELEFCPRDCVVGPWSEWKACSDTCGGGTKTRKRIITVEPLHGGMPCPDVHESEDCNTDIPCPHPCKMGPWDDWSPCSKSCGLGKRTRSREVKEEAKYGGKCDEATEASEECEDLEFCPQPCDVSAWTDWTDCSDTCGGGTKTRKRKVIAEADHGGTPCPDLDQSEDCNTDIECPHPCEWSQWGDWSECSASCKAGKRTRTREVKVEAKHGGECDGATEASEECEDLEFCPSDCVVGAWTDWTACSDTCGGGTKTRKRTVITEPLHGGMPCPELHESEDCNKNPCPHPCKMGPWDDWSPCSNSCEAGKRTRSRDVKEEATYGGKCDEATEASEECEDLQFCPHPCVVGPWSEWKACSDTCGGGTKTRKRIITVEPLHGGMPCPDLSQSEDCNTDIPCPHPCEWSQWGDWSPCSASCESGERTRTREVKVEAKHGGKCDGKTEATEDCERPVKCPQDCVVGPWTKWTECSASCGGGSQTRKRTVKIEAQHGGQKCPELDESQNCEEQQCPEDCCVDDWSEWSACSGGQQSRTRTVTREAKYGGACPDLKDSKTCGGDGPINPEDVTTIKVCGQVKDASNHDKKLEGVRVTSSDGTASTPPTTKADGMFCFELPVGSVLLTAEKEGYVTEKDVERVVVEGQNTIKDIEMSSVLKDGEWRIVMSWENKPWDLDSWTMFGKGTTTEQNFFYYYAGAGGWDAEKCSVDCPHKASSGCVMNWIYKENAVSNSKVHQPVACSTSGVSAFMDQDNKNITTNPYAETTTLSGVDGTKCGDDCSIHFCVYQYAPRPTPNLIRESGATVEVYNGAGGKAKKVGHFEIEKDGIVKDLNDKAQPPVAGAAQWFVFSIDAKTQSVTPCTDLTSECAKTPCGQHYAR